MQPAFVFAGDAFETDPELKLAKSMLLDFFRGRTVEHINLKASSEHSCTLHPARNMRGRPLLKRERHSYHATGIALFELLVKLE